MSFWVIIVLMALIITVAFAGTLLAKSKMSDSDDDVAPGHDMQVYRDQLKELERDKARGTITPDEAERAQLEISRRLLGADKASQDAKAAPVAPQNLTYAAIIFSVLVVFGGGAWGYMKLGVNAFGQNSYPDMPLSGRLAAAEEMRATRPSQAEMEATLPAWEGPDADIPADYLEIVAKLRTAVLERPGDLQGNELLAVHEARLGNFVAAHQAKSTAITAMGGQAKAGDYAQLVDLLALAARGYISPEAEAALIEALKRDPDSLVGRYYSGLMFTQTGRPDRAFRVWRGLLNDSPADAPWVPSVRAQMGQLAAFSGVQYSLPPLAQAPAANGPTAEDIAAASDMSPEDRSAMVENMVSQLMARMAAEGGSPPEWAQLITALATLGRTDRAIAIWGEAQRTFADFPAELRMINAAAASAGLEMQGSPEEAGERARITELESIAAQLSDRLASVGGPAEDWANLIRVFGELNQAGRAEMVWNQAKQVFAPHPEEFAMLQETARAAGVDVDE